MWSVIHTCPPPRCNLKTEFLQGSDCEDEALLVFNPSVSPNVYSAPATAWSSVSPRRARPQPFAVHFQVSHLQQAAAAGRLFLL